MANKRIKDLTITATEADLVGTNYIPIDGASGTKKLPASDIAPKSLVHTNPASPHPYVLWRGGKVDVLNIGDASSQIENAVILVDAPAYGGSIPASVFARSSAVKNREYQTTISNNSISVSSSRSFLSAVSIPANTKFRIKITAGTASWNSLDITPSQDGDDVRLANLVSGVVYEAKYPYAVEAIYYKLDNAATDGTITLELEYFPADTFPSSIGNSDFGTKGENLFNIDAPDNSVGYFVRSDTGWLAANSSYCATSYIPIEEGVTYYRNYIHNFAWYNASKSFISGGNTGASITAPANAKYVRLTISKYNYESFVFSEAPITGYAPFGWMVSPQNNNGIGRNESLMIKKSYSAMGVRTLTAESQSLASSASLYIDTFPQHIKKGMVFNVSLDPSNFSQITFGTGSSSDYESTYVSVSTSSVTFKRRGSGGEMVLGTFTHGLTISTFLRIDSSVNDDGDWQVVVSTLGGAYKCSKNQMFSNRGVPFVRNDGASDLSDVLMVVGNKDLKQPVWVFGDSYLGLYDNVRSPYWLRDWGYKNGLYCGFPGAKSSDILPSLYYAVKLAQPKYIVWMLGMNDTYAQWSEYVGIVKSICDCYGIELILATIPPVPSHLDNVDKNNDIESWGYRYIDQAKAVGADSSGSWYTGLLSSDNVHPTELGAKALASQILLDFPEIME